VPVTESRYDPQYCPAKGCVVNKIVDFKRVLLDPKADRSKRQQALKFLVHLVADLHHPLHVGDTGSRGGNSIQARFFNKGTNLHKLWDLQIMERHSENEREWLWELGFLANPRMVTEWAKGTPEDWATESLRIAKEAYCHPGAKTVMKSGTRLGDEYYQSALLIIQEQLAKAGIRLAWTLNEIFR
jgi:hypothetical protein